MKVVVTRCTEAKVEVNNITVGQINDGLLVLVGFKKNDTLDDIKYIVNKIINLRIFDDKNGIMNLSALELNKQVLLVSQFTLYANTKNGRRPSYIESLNHEDAKKLYELFVEDLKKYLNVETGIFRENMKVYSINDGPTTIIIESGDRYDKK